ncbi:hypothetical protein [Streptomyces sp. NPDC013740]|uniref:hypothetical protein n=1 Tax=Streptomyces sp. NPDC013740 TaxID=3364867 RepID=UPI0036F7DF9E
MATRHSSATSAIWGPAADPDTTRKPLPVRAGLAAFALLAALATCAPPHGDAPREGNALTGGMSGLPSSEHAKVGQSWWFGLGTLRNRWDSPVELTDVRVLDLPEGLAVGRYAAFDSKETGGLLLVYQDGDPAFPTSTYKDHAKQPVELPPGEDSSLFYAVKTTVTGPLSGESSRCRYTYTQGSETFTQDLPCRFTLSLEK